MTKRGKGRNLVGQRLPSYMVLVMSGIAVKERRSLRRIALKATRPALNDLRFKGDAEVIADGDEAVVCLGNYQLTRVECTPLDLPTLNRTFSDIRIGQARLQISRKR